MTTPNDTTPFESEEQFQKEYTPQGGLANILNFYTKEEEGSESSTEGKEKDETDKDTTPADPASPPEEDELEEEFKGKPINEVVTSLKEARTALEEQRSKYQAIENELKSLKENPNTGDEKLKGFITELKKDPFKAWQQFSKELELPNIEMFRTVVNTNGDVKARLKIYQENELKKKIEEQFNLDSGTFKFDADEAENPEKPSYEFRRLSRMKEAELEAEVSNAIQKVRDGEKLVRERQKEDKQWYADTYLGGDVKKADEAVRLMSSIPEKILKGELPPHKHPFSTRTLLLGVNHDELVKEALEKQKTEIMQALASKGFKLKAEELPEGLKHIKKSQAGDGDKKPAKTGIPSLDMLNSFAN